MGKRAVIVTNIDTILFKKGITQGKLAEMTNLRPTTISEIVRGSRSVINKEHLARIADALEVSDISKLLEIAYVQDSEEYVRNKNGYIRVNRNIEE